MSFQAAILQKVQQRQAMQPQGSAKIDDLITTLKGSQQTDDLTLLLKDICNRFSSLSCFKFSLQSWEEQLIEALQITLVDGYFDIKQGAKCSFEEFVLGSDGFTYSEKVLKLVYDELDEAYQDLSPITLAPNFYVVPHEAANACVEWIKKYGTFTENQAVADAYQQLKDNGYEVPLPTPYNQALRKGIRDQVRLVQAKDAAIDTLAKQIDAMASDLLQQLRDGFASIVNGSDDALKDLINQLDTLTKEDQEWAVKLAAEIALLDAEIARLEADNEDLDAKINRVAFLISEAESQIAYLKKLVNDIRIQIAKAAKARKKALLIKVIFGVVNLAMAAYTGGTLAFCKEIGLGIARGAVSHGLSCTRLGSEVKAILSSTINGGISAPGFGMPIPEGVIRGQLQGIAGLFISHFGPRDPMLQDTLQAAAGTTVMTKNPTTLHVMKNAVVAVPMGVIASESGASVSAAVLKNNTISFTVAP